MEEKQMKISKILAGMSAAAIVASMAMIPASAAGTKLNVSDDLLLMKQLLLRQTSLEVLFLSLMRRTMTVLLQRQVFLQEQTLSFQMFAVLMLM